MQAELRSCSLWRHFSQAASDETKARCKLILTGHSDWCPGLWIQLDGRLRQVF